MGGNYGYPCSSPGDPLTRTTAALWVNCHGKSYCNEDFEPIKRLFAAGNNCGGRFGFQYSTSIPGESLDLATARHLIEKGYHEYLPGCWAKPGRECRDLLVSQSTENYLSFGPGTISRVDGGLSRTTENIAVYTLHPQEPELLYKPVAEA